MRKKIILSLIIAYLIVISHTKAATNLEISEIDEITREPWTVFTIYLGMPTEQFVDNFSRLNNWYNEKYQLDRSFRGKPEYSINYKRIYPRMNITETVGVESLLNGGVICVTISITGSYSDCQMLCQRAFNNIKSKINISPKIWRNEGVTSGVHDPQFCAQWNDANNDREISVKVYNMGYDIGLLQIDRYKMEAVI
ncbi:hypothetical protein SAMN04487861_1281 [Selenomonas ruminantium]|uniref:Uncharacterized protein n=1 Tax=Selenomonas ruminantium TaxID=971 RepID=A0A1I3H756_SELRU|nr:hypothetical protein [Selenomonas ruminantium]SFI31598.1 hypothetical protein SAMN04487861_1281 [Selenomonas ruminantium]